MLLVRHGPSTVEAARVGEPTLVDTKQVYAPDVTKQTQAVFVAAMKGQPIPGAASAGDSESSAAIANGTAPPRTDQPATAASFENVPDASGSVGSTVTVEVPSGGEAAAPSGSEAAPAGSEAAPASGSPAAPANANSAATEPVIKPVGPPESKALPPVDKPAEAPAQINDVKSGQSAQVNTGANSSGKKKKAPYNSKEESSSKHKKKKGLDKLNPF